MSKIVKLMYYLSRALTCRGLSGQVKAMYPTAGSLGDVMTMRYGPVMKGCIVIVALFNMSIFMLAEFTTIGALFQDFVGSKNYPIIIVMAVLTTGYSCYGGLVVSIVTDQIQAIVSLLFLLVLSIYVWVWFKQPLEAGWGDLKPLLGPNEAGLGAIYVMPASLMASTLFNEGMWQRVWAAQDRRALQNGAIGGCCAVITAIFLFGLFGYIACWGGLVDYASTNVNLYLFQVRGRGLTPLLCGPRFAQPCRMSLPSSNCNSYSARFNVRALS